MAKPSTATKALAGAAGGAGVYFGGQAVGNAANVAPGFMRGGIGLALTLVIFGVTTSLKATKAFAGSLATGGVIGAVALMFEPQLKSFMAERAAAAPLPSQEEFFAATPPPAAPSPPQVVQQAPAREPTIVEQIMPGITAGFGMLGNIFGSSGSGGLLRRATAGAGLTFGKPHGAGARLGLYEAMRN